ncbi:lysine--tRNA ligase [Ktedonosporobacter rubrisoli]|uniref:Lysine--tRNA ligase n=1 Tax=Ktedonosporobacter rubrisoli TaxID=2509675 RepID=A0A4P6JM32_KTERU|nr:lysine--tRNA ligase [Ktedonosporobacter rubrisoli]QBD75726.1 lysine--tRNA ligase [Ktedonosporobacter rubrisoli]
MKSDWVEQLCDRIELQVQKTKGAAATIICSSGISPSGPIHLGNLREVMTPHIIVEELRKRGRQVEHLHIWDDFDRLRKIPANVPADFAKYIGCPLADIPDPWDEYASYAERYMADFTQSLQRLGIAPRFVRQSLAYRSGNYTAQIKEAMAQRFKIFDIISSFQTLPGQQESAEERRASYYPLRVYCENCHKDTTTISQYDEETARIAYACSSCQYEGAFSLNEKVECKLVWKVDWPMRWSALGVDCEPAGADHAAPNSSFSVGRQIVQAIYHTSPPQFVGFGFVGMEGRTKISSSAGTSATISSALDIIEPCILRWLYTRRSYNQTFMIDFGQGLLRLYDEWDTLVKQQREGKASEANAKAYERAIHTSEGPVGSTPQPVPFHLLTSVLDVTQGNVAQMLRIVAQYNGQDLTQELRPELLEPRLSCALNWVTRYLPEDERTPIRSAFNAEAYEQLSELDRASVQMLAEQLDMSWKLDALTNLIYNIAKIVRGLPVDTPPDAALKQAQRSFFIAIYQLICGRDTGPRIPTLLLSLGKEKVKALLVPQV